MKTTVEIPDKLFREAKRHCAQHGLTFRQLIESGLRSAIEPPAPRKKFKLAPYGFRGEGQQIRDWAAIRELIYEGRGGAPPLDAKE